MTREISRKGDVRPITPPDEEGSHWHRADIIRLRHHPCLRLPTETPDQPDPNSGGPTFYAMADGILVRAGVNISLVEWWRDPEGGLAKWIEPPNSREFIIPVLSPVEDHSSPGPNGCRAAAPQHSTGGQKERHAPPTL
ncbi:hypothetical protein BDK51DRAFT_34460 [Blyttiomyces helicus]|uniref:Uncharacterized protein n=1 Tax=Blyttiomyces helicus TaxID=388810 RepID=A0A4P9VW18_9FUNG|nr:hypothetical protein BDK51DRAFT_34460 [Blyttiomyces helicus]|eukprot:RKO83889.1 hypothetical protein BDK51DRAFT_34460 [Blyttiomyces helicus]